MSSAPKIVGLSSGSQVLEVTRPMMNISGRGKAVVTKVLTDSTLRSSYTGVDAGTGDVTIGLPVIPGVGGKTLKFVVCDNYGRVVSGVDSDAGGNIGFTTTDVPEGINLYFSTSRVRHSLHGENGISVDQNTGAISLLPTESSGEHTAVIVDDYGRVIGFRNYSTLYEYGISDAYTKTETDSRIQEAVDLAIQTYLVSKLGQPNGIATLNGAGKVPASQLDVTSDKEFVFLQETPSTVWIITHNLNTYPTVTCVDPSTDPPTDFEGDVDYLSPNQLRIDFNEPSSGKAVLR